MKKSILTFWCTIIVYVALGQTLTYQHVKSEDSLYEAKNCLTINKPLALELDSIFVDDQIYRIQLDSVASKYGALSKESFALAKKMSHYDAMNQIKVEAILDKYGWLGPEVVGMTGSCALFAVIQHAGLQTQKKYLPMLKKAVKNGKARGENLALLEDRINIREGKEQVYGSQTTMDNKTGIYHVYAMIDPDNVDKRRAEVGLAPMAEYCKSFNIKWDLEQYKKDLPMYKRQLREQYYLTRLIQNYIPNLIIVLSILVLIVAGIIKIFYRKLNRKWFRIPLFSIIISIVASFLWVYFS